MSTKLELTMSEAAVLISALNEIERLRAECDAAVAAEREACAQVALFTSTVPHVGPAIAAAIRARRKS